MSSSHEPSKAEKAEVKSRLRALFEAISDEASKNPAFMLRLEEIFTSSGGQGGQKKSTSTNRPVVNILEILNESGEVGLKESLEKLTTDALVKLCAQESVRKLKEAKSIERGELISLLIQAATNRLKQGDSFVKRG